MKLILLRHGECSTGRCYTGKGSDVPLNEMGIKQISGLNLFPERSDNKKVIIFSSSLIRAKESANIISKKYSISKIITDNRLDEIHFGDWEGLTYQNIMDKWPIIATKWYDNPINITPPGGENYSNFINRITDFWVELNHRYFDREIIIVSHGGVIQVLSTLINNVGIDKRWDYNIKRGEFKVYSNL